MRLLGNILWHFPFLGFLTALGALLWGLFLVILVIPAPIGLSLIQYARFLLAPFSYEMVDRGELPIKQNPLWRAYSFIIMLLYLPFGIFFTLAVLFQIIGLFLSIVGIPVALVLIKSLPVFLNPVNKVCVPINHGEPADPSGGLDASSHRSYPLPSDYNQGVHHARTYRKNRRRSGGEPLQ